MTDGELKAKLLAEIERRLQYTLSLKQIIAYEEILDFIKSLPEEPVSEDLEEVSELAEFEKTVKGLLFDAGDKYNLNDDLDKATKDLAPHFLEAARKQIASEIDIDGMMAKMFDPHEGQSQIPRSFYRQGIEDTIKIIKKGVKDDIK